jgi:hypothetical protein
VLIGKIENPELVILHLNIKTETIFVYDNSMAYYAIKCMSEEFGDFVKNSDSVKSDMPLVSKQIIVQPLIKNLING